MIEAISNKAVIDSLLQKSTARRLFSIHDTETVPTGRQILRRRRPWTTEVPCKKASQDAMKIDMVLGGAMKAEAVMG